MIVFLQRGNQLQSNGRLARSFFAENNRGTWIAAVTQNLVPRWMVNRLSTMLLKNVVRLSVFLTERIDFYSVVFKKLLYLHGILAFAISVCFDAVAGLANVPLSPAIGFPISPVFLGGRELG